ncbi:tubulin-folding cofactor B isoform X1 [Cucumis melo var. makuwa]|uniref:Tubulin-folding cofactor B isoform X1 n=1 Tax=Cucumis melo var. makuwa TaxID=1194695 RepID=A0A5A7V400_CUCMM|nr:tubulin-folding cofactor B isoform X1 [Cucumis melo var. makuwa]
MYSRRSSMRVGDRCQVEPGEKRGVVKFVGRAESLAPGFWVGVQYDEPLGKNDGTVKGIHYFDCSPLHGAMVRPDKVKVQFSAPLICFPTLKLRSSCHNLCYGHPSRFSYLNLNNPSPSRLDERSESVIDPLENEHCYILRVSLLATILNGTLSTMKKMRYEQFILRLMAFAHGGLIWFHELYLKEAIFSAGNFSRENIKENNDDVQIFGDCCIEKGCIFLVGCYELLHC